MSQSSVLQRLRGTLLCDNNSCCCIPRRSAVIILSIINFFGCFVDLKASDGYSDNTCYNAKEIPESARKFLTSLFQVANILLFLASVFEVAILVDIYVWYTLGFIVLGLVVTLYEFVLKMQNDTTKSSFVAFVPEIIFFFVLIRCLPLIDVYRRHLYSIKQ